MQSQALFNDCVSYNPLTSELTISGAVFNSAAVVDNVKVGRQGKKLIVDVYVRSVLFDYSHRSGGFKKVIHIDPEIVQVVFGADEKLLWDRYSKPGAGGPFLNQCP